MAEIAVLASGSGSNFQALAEKLPAAGHKICCLIYDRKNAYAGERAEKLEIPAHYVCYPGKTKQEAEAEIFEIINRYNTQLIVLAGYMRLFTAWFINKFPGKIVNIHPSLLPEYPGTHGIEESYNSVDRELGITIHFIDEGLDTGPVIVQKSFMRKSTESLEEIEEKIHKLEHEWYPKIITGLLDKAASDMDYVASSIKNN